jgi:hypothetical protein
MRKKRMQCGGLSNTKTWWSWHFMKQRVLNPSNKRHDCYRGRSIDPLWMSFSVAEEYGVTIDAISGIKSGRRWKGVAI